ncbi:superoxide dismutase family protein [Streptomyces sp. TRM70350]|uniref:superoxide dismutase family protein n=1 Tax=Streptomyces sp. TRM70350 TaxID=2856165 RepID=UPI001C4883A2|nr:superoxide dismutase family protein [Streptomyces sp. TRM70350]MBV7696097.1 superoxide dismutase family protein [Streptomyces sp. TRM70350]
MSKHKLTTQHKGLLAVVAGVGAVALGVGVMATAGATESRGAKPPVRKVVVKTAFSPASTAPKAEAVTYNSELVPVSGRVQVKEELRRNGGTRIELRLRDLVPNRVYGAHVHTKPCGALPADSGPHYQNRVDPVQPSVDPDFANPRNEVWLDLTTNKDGSDRSIAIVDWRFREGGARSVVLHEMATSTHEGHAGTAGARLACINVPFE